MPTGTISAQVTGEAFPEFGESQTSNLYLFYMMRNACCRHTETEELFDLLSDRVMDNTGSEEAFSMFRSLFRPMKKWRVSVIRSVKADAVIFSGD